MKCSAAKSEEWVVIANGDCNLKHSGQSGCMLHLNHHHHHHHQHHHNRDFRYCPSLRSKSPSLLLTNIFITIVFYTFWSNMLGATFAWARTIVLFSSLTHCLRLKLCAICIFVEDNSFPSEHWTKQILKAIAWENLQYWCWPLTLLQMQHNTTICIFLRKRMLCV